MEQVNIIGIDLAKRSFQLHGARADGSVAFRRKVSRERLLYILGAQLPRCVVAMEACASAHYWGREILKLGHEVRLVPPIYVKPFVKRQKNDAADAEAICEASQRPTMRFVAVKGEEQQARAMLFHTRDLLVRQRTQTINALRGHLAEFGVVAPQGPGRISMMGQRDLRRLLIIGAMAVVSSAVRHRRNERPLAGQDAGAQAANAGRGGAGQQDGAHRLGAHDTQGDLQRFCAGCCLTRRQPRGMTSAV